MTYYYKGLYLICLFLSIAFGVAAQQPCGTGAPDPAEEARLAGIMQQALSERRDTDSAWARIYYVPLKIHIVRHSKGEVAIEESRVLAHLTEANKHFLGAGLQFYMAGDFNYIDLDQAFYLRESEHHILTSNTAKYKMEGVINLFYPHNIDGPRGFAEFPPSTYVVVAGNISDPKTLIHEFGHSFFRTHTHAANETELHERVDGSNCHAAGDNVCDTPADPYGLPGASADINGYTGTVTDANGDLYAPMLENFMSYWERSYIFQKFTLQQLQFMRLVCENYFGPEGFYPFNHNHMPVNAPSALTASFQAGVETPSFVHLKWQDNSSNETSFFIERSTFPDHGFYSVGYSVRNTTEFDDKTANADQTYYYRIRPVNSRNAFSEVISIQTPAFYCVPSADPCSTHSKIIHNFNISSGNNVIVNGNPDSCFSYSYLSRPASTLQAANSYTLSLKIENGHEMFSTAWIDYNRNMQFEDEEVIYSSGSAMNVHTADFDVPENLTDGLYRMRIRAEFVQSEAKSSCTAAYFFGEIRDIEFSINAQVTHSAEQLPDAGIMIFPNPAEDHVNIRMPAGLRWEKIELLDARGVRVAEKNYSSGSSISFITSSLNAGFYVVRISTSTHVLSRKVVIQK